MGPEVSHIVVHHEEVLETLHHRRIGFPVSVDDEGLLVDRRDLAAVVEGQTKRCHSHFGHCWGGGGGLGHRVGVGCHGD